MTRPLVGGLKSDSDGQVQNQWVGRFGYVGT